MSSRGTPMGSMENILLRGDHKASRKQLNRIGSAHNLSDKSRPNSSRGMSMTRLNTLDEGLKRSVSVVERGSHSNVRGSREPVRGSSQHIRESKEHLGSKEMVIGIPPARGHTTVVWKKSFTSETTLNRMKKAHKLLPKTDRIKILFGHADFRKYRTALSTLLTGLDVHVKENTASVIIDQCIEQATFLIREVIPEMVGVFENQISDLKEQFTSMDDKAALIKLLLRIQESILNVLDHFVETHHKAVQEFEAIEEENTLFRDFVEQHSAYSPDHIVEIQVKQVLQLDAAAKPTVDEITDTLDLPVPEVVPTPIVRLVDPVKPCKTIFVQTDPMEVVAQTPVQVVAVAPVPDMLDSVFAQMMAPETEEKSCGSDKPIPTFKQVGVVTDIPHPLEALYAQLTIDFASSTAQKDKTIQDLELELHNLTEGYQANMSKAESGLTEQLKKLQSDFSTVRTKLNDATNEISTFEFEKAQVATEMNEYRSQAQFLRNELEAAKRQIATMQLEVESARTKVLMSAEEVKKMNAKVTKVNEDNLGLTKNLKSLTNEHEEVNEKLTKVSLSIKTLKEQNTTFKMENDTMLGESNRLKTANATLTETNKKILTQNRLEVEAKMQTEAKNERLEEVIAELMRYPDLSLDVKLKDLLPSDDTSLSMKQMIETNNLRISLLEQRNERYRAKLLGQIETDGHEDYILYNPLKSTLLFNKDAVQDQKRPESTNSITTYIIGSSHDSRPVSASSLHFIRPKSSDMFNISRPLSRAYTPREPGRSRTKSPHIDFMSNHLHDSHYPPRELASYLTEDVLSRCQDESIRSLQETPSIHVSLKSLDRPKSKTPPSILKRPDSRGLSVRWLE